MTLERQLLQSIAASGVEDKHNLLTTASPIEVRINDLIEKVQSKIESTRKYSKVVYNINRQSIKDLFESILTIYDMQAAPVVDQNDLLAKAIDFHTTSELLDGQKILIKMVKVSIIYFSKEQTKNG